MSNSLRQYKIKKLLEELEKKKGRGTELISLYIPSGRQVGDIMNVLREEYSTASNIKDRTTRHHVLDALTVVMQRLKLFRKIPENGLIIFAGYIAGDAPGKERMEVHVLEPPEKLRTYLYRCNSRFHVEILKDMLSTEEVYGLIVIERGEAAIGVLRGPIVEVVKVLTSGIPGKHRSGGQSARRFDRIIEQLAHEFYKRIGEYANRIFLKIPNLKGIIIGGPGPSKEEFFEKDYLHYELKKKILGIVDIGYGGEIGIYELAKRGSKLIQSTEYYRERKIMQDFLYHVSRDTGLALYGFLEVITALKQGLLKTLLVSEDLRKKIFKVKCMNCNINFRYISEYKPEKCVKCGSENIDIIEENKLIDWLIENAVNNNVEVEVISSKTEEGQELLRSFSGVAGILRYKIASLNIDENIWIE
ncbi:MAG: peptide chain release factor 1 [Thermoprotei archaeon]|nr:MAG: peptide chain release factor 1 [Thermoprotei archaeon]